MRRRGRSVGLDQGAVLQRPLKMLRGITWAFVLPGVGMLAGAAFAAWLELSFRAATIEAEGAVLRLVEARSEAGRVSVVPLVALRLPDGARTEMRVATGTDANCCRTGDAVAVRYDPADPSGARLGGFMASWLLPTMAGVAGVVFVLAGLLAGRMIRRLVGRLTTPAAGELELSIEARVVGVRQEATPRGPAWVVQARAVHPATGQEQVFEGHPLPFDPTAQMEGIRWVEVIFDPAAPDGPCTMELGFLRPLAGPVRRG